MYIPNTNSFSTNRLDYLCFASGFDIIVAVIIPSDNK